MRYLILFLAALSAWGQVEDYGRTANAAAIYDLTASAITRSIKSGASDPATCTSGKDLFINTSSTPVVKLCTATNTWTTLGSSGSAATLTTPRAIYGNNFDGSAALTQIIASTYGGTGNGFTKFSGPASTEKTFTLPNASATILTDNALVTAAQGGTGNGFFAVTGPATSTKTFTFPNASATVLTTNAAVTVAQGGTGVSTLTGIVKASGTSNFAAAGYADIVGLWTTCTGFLKNDGTCASAGSGTVTVVSSGSLTSTALVTGGGTTTLQTPSATATLDSSGNISTPGSITTGAGGSNAGVLELTQGTAPTAGTTSVKLYAPASVTSYIMNLPGAAASGYLYGTNSSGVVTQSFRSIQAGDVPTLNQNTTGTAAALAANGANCSAGSFPLGVDASGAVETCTAVTSINVTAAQMPALTGDVTTSAGAVATTIAANAVTPAKASAVMRTRTFTMVIPGTGASNVLQDTDDQPAVWYNSLGQGVHITGVSCITDSATATTIQLQKNDGSPTNMLSSNLSCSSTRASTSTFVSGEDAMASTTGLDFLIVSAGGAGKWVSVTVTYTLD